MPAWIRGMLAQPDEPVSPLARYTMRNGVLYLGIGLQLYFWPGAAQVLFRAEVEHPQVAAVPVPFPVDAEKLAEAPPDSVPKTFSSLDDSGGDE